MEEKRKRKGQEARRRHDRVRVHADPEPACKHVKTGSSILDLIKKQHGSFSRYFRIYRGFLSRTGDRTPINTHGPITLFPSLLPWTSPPGKSKRRGLMRQHQFEALEWMHQLWALFNFLDSGSPCSTEGALSSVERASRGEWTALHEKYARAMFNKVLNYCACPRGTMERGTSQLQKLVERIQSSQYDPSIDLDTALTGALEVDPSRISLPEKAGVLDPKEHLKGRHLEEYLRMPFDIPTSCCKSDDPPACHKVKDEDWGYLLRKLHAAQMVTFLPKSQALKEGKKLIKGGLFAVPHKESSDRLINDRRPLNARENKLGWCELPAGPMLAQLILEETESIRASGDDLSNYFYLIKHLEEWQPRNCFGKEFKGKLLPDLGLSPNETYVAAFRVLCMGDQNGVCIAQATHEAVLKASGCLEDKNTLRYGKPFPAARTLEGLYIDDHLVFQIVDKKQYRNRNPEEDTRLIDASRDRYAELGLPTSKKKAFDKEYSFKAWGTCVDSKTGRVGAPVPKLRQIESLTLVLLEDGRITQKALQKLIGLFVHPFMHRRECMCVFHHIYMYLEKMNPNVSTRLPHYIRDELSIAALLLPLSCSSARWPVCVRIAATDASSSGGGRASTVTTRGFAKSLYRLGEQRGEHTRLDWDNHALEPPSRMRPTPKIVIDNLMQHHWAATQATRFQRKEHINLLELEMIKQEVKHRVNEGLGFSRVVNLCDSRVVVGGAWAKGRSSSRQMNHRLRSCLPWVLTGEISITNLWTDTKNNPADYPSRGKPIPAPNSLCPPKVPLFNDEDFQKLRVRTSPAEQQLIAGESQRSRSDRVLSKPVVKAEGGKDAVRETSVVSAKGDRVDEQRQPRIFFREIFAGKAKLSEAMGRVAGCEVLEPVDIKPHSTGIHSQDILNNIFFRRLKKEAARDNQLWHFGLPCGSFSVLQHSNKGTRRKNNPSGNNTLLREIIGNEILRRTVILIEILEENGNHWTLENPASSYAWLMPLLKKKCNRAECGIVDMDQCAYGLKLPDQGGVYGPCKKHTRFAGNMVGLNQLARRCSCDTNHVHAVGGVRTQGGWKKRSELAGHYPAALCKKYASIVSQHI